MATGLLAENIKSRQELIYEGESGDIASLRAIADPVEDWISSYNGWSSAITYEAGEVINYGGVLYRATASNLDKQPDLYLGVYWELYGTDIFATVDHNHDLTYLGITDKAADSQLLDGIDSTRFPYGNTATGAYQVTSGSTQDIDRSGFMDWSNVLTDKPTGETGWMWGLHSEHGNANGYGMSLAFGQNTNKLWWRRKESNVYSDWIQVLTLEDSGLFALASHNHDSTYFSLTGNGLVYKADIPTSADLNTYTIAGLYHQNSTANAAAGTNYPTALAGMLSVTADGVMVYQKYETYNNTGVYVRTYYNGTWYDWLKLLTSSGGGSATDLLITGNLDIGNSVTGRFSHSTAVSSYAYSSAGTDPDSGVVCNGDFSARQIWNATLGDIAEFFYKVDNCNAQPGDVISINEEGKVDICNSKKDKRVLGVYSDTFAYALMSKDKDQKIPVALTGSVRVKVCEKLKIGDMLVAGKNGFAVKSMSGPYILKVLENKTNTNIERIKCLVWMG